MAYNSDNATEAKMLEPDQVLDGEIVEIKDGTVKDFVLNTEKWQGSTSQPAINVTVKVGDQTFAQLFTYNEENGKTLYTKNSNIGKYKVKYGNLPKSGDRVKVATNAEGFGRIKLD